MTRPGESFSVVGLPGGPRVVTIEEALAWLDGHVNLETGVGFVADA